MIISQLIGRNQQQAAQEAAEDAQDVQEQASIYDHLIGDPNTPLPLRLAAHKHGMGLLEEHGGKDIQDQLPQFGQLLSGLATQSAMKGAQNQLVAQAQQQDTQAKLADWTDLGWTTPPLPDDRYPVGQGAPQAAATSPTPNAGGTSLRTLAGLPQQTPPPQPQQPGALPPGMPGRPAPTPMTSPLPEWMKGPATPLDRGAPVALADLPRQTPSPGPALAAAGLPDDPNAPPSLRTLAGLPTRGVPQEAWRASLKPEPAGPAQKQKDPRGFREKLADALIGFGGGMTGSYPPGYLADLELRNQQRLQQQRLGQLNNALVQGWISPEQFEQARADLITQGITPTGVASRQRVNLTYPDGTDVTLDHDPRTGKFYNVAGQQVNPPAGTTFALPPGVAREKDLDVEAEEIAGSIMRGERPPLTTGLGRAGLGGKVAAILAKNHFDVKAAELDWKVAVKAYMVANDDRQLRLRQATTFALSSLDQLDNPEHPGNDLIGELRRLVPTGKYPILNRAAITAAKQGTFGDAAASAATQLENQIGDLHAELAVVYMGGNTPTDQGIDLAKKQLEGDWSEKVLRDNIGRARKNLGLRLGSLRQVPIGLSPEGQQAYGFTGAGGASPAAGGAAGGTGAGAGASPVLPKPTTPGQKITTENAIKYIQAYGSEAKGREAAKRDGWGVD